MTSFHVFPWGYIDSISSLVQLLACSASYSTLSPVFCLVLTVAPGWRVCGEGHVTEMGAFKDMANRFVRQINHQHLKRQASSSGSFDDWQSKLSFYSFRRSSF